MKKHRSYEDLGEAVLSPEVEARMEAAIDQAERDLGEARVNLRWGRAQVAVVKRAAELAGVPYQTYMKQVVFRRAVEDLKDAAEVGVHSR